MGLSYLEVKRGSSDLSLIISTNYKKVKNHFSKRNTNCFRVYDRDLDSFPVTIDYYDGSFVVNYYWKRESTESEIENLVKEVNSAILETFDIVQNKIFHKYRKLDYDSNLFENSEGESSFFPVYENGIGFIVNLRDYLDTGLFLDHSPAREIALWMAKGKRVLNLFSYTSSFSLYVLKGGATFCKSVDISNTYVEWSKKNHMVNKVDEKMYEVKKDDCLSHLKYLNKRGEKYDLIIMDPPSFSRAKKMKKSVFHVQKDHREMIIDACNLLNPGGTLLFSNNLTTFRMDKFILRDYFVEDISKRTIPFGFKNRKIHKAYLIRNKE